MTAYLERFLVIMRFAETHGALIRFY
jgi:hypothetical protein